ncbi:hypothetical protein QBC34DRAFT_437267 [Podospora aff. communis PSN243]|uniref:Oligopeptide transporter n=1 Tax=Podospora aff. communis PSN243 TaxID=3040156 RepID=A0AAV9GP89_9PEZI|nr:hypothetical protein QBC34DRAFT_437267 [Podospora aff. communis PSN243]
MATQALSTRKRSADWYWDGQHHFHSHSTSSETVSGATLENHGPWAQQVEGFDSRTKAVDIDFRGHERSLLKLNRDLRTRNLSIVGLVFAWATAIATLTTGILILISPNVNAPEYLVGKAVMIGPTPYMWPKVTRYPGGHRIYKVNEFGMIVLPLVLQVAITLIIGCLESIHATTLRWALWHEGRLRYNSNLRLFTSSRRFGPNKWPANTAAIIGLVLSYGGASIMTFPVQVTAIVLSAGRMLDLDYNIDHLQDRTAIDFNGWGLVGLGTGLLLQSIISSWALLDSSYVGTWNGNPLATARACQILKATTHNPFHSSPHLLHTSDIELLPSPAQPIQPPPKPTLPTPLQPSALTLSPHTRPLTHLLWAVFTLTALLLLTITIRASLPSASNSFPGPTTSLTFVRSYSGHSTPWYTFQFFGMVEGVYNKNPYASRREYIGLLIQSAVLCIPVFGLHVADLLCQMQRDEAIWRRAATEGVDPDGSLWVQGLRSGPSWVVFLAKAIVPWVFGFAVGCNRNIYFATLPSLVVAVVFLGLAVTVEVLVRRKPRGMQPAAYGDVVVLGGLVDDWGVERVFWGDRGAWCEDGEGEVRVAGTAGTRLADLREGVRYVGLGSRSGVV